MADRNAVVGNDDTRFGGQRDEPRIVESKTEARAGDRHRENLYALVFGTIVAAAVLLLLYAFQVI
ncbi:hypothetical protein ACFOGJ_16675 [Marinibaculum pumilum]|uniref:Uncharacterized protein n=1 Tax=Marinibaculum pumilum TaxID=1766165 RepID=A0ABV7L2Q4_9PROT